MRGSAAAVGVMMTAIMEPEMEDAALPHAIKLGEAFQLTNFLRDVREDILDRDRIYLPKRRSRDTTSARKKLNASSTLRSLERRWHTNSSALRTCTERALPVSAICEDCQLPVLLSAVLYAEHHALIRNQEYDVLSAGPSLSTTRKLWCLAKTRWHWHWNRDPEAVFHRVSAIPTVDPDPHGRSPGHGDSIPTQ